MGGKKESGTRFTRGRKMCQRKKWRRRRKKKTKWKKKCEGAVEEKVTVKKTTGTRDVRRERCQQGEEERVEK